MNDWIRVFHPAPEAPARLLVFPHAGGAAGAYYALSAEVTGRLEPLLVQYPGRHDRFREPFAERIDDVVDAVLNALPADPAGRPLALFGHSMGATVAYETARRLQERGATPAALFVSGREGPSLPPALRWPSDPTDAELIADMQLLAGTENELLTEPALLELILPALRADYRMLFAHTHRPGPRLHCPLIALTGDNDPRVAVPRVAAWEPETTDPFTTHVLAGGHFYLDEHLAYVVEVITGAVSGAATGRSVG